MKEKYRYYLKNVTAPVLVYGAFTGLLVGTVVYFFKLGAEWLSENPPKSIMPHRQIRGLFSP